MTSRCSWAHLLAGGRHHASLTCGAKTTPCATIGQAVLNATAGSKIVVGPGHYPGGIDLDKVGMKLESTSGARATVIEGGLSEVVRISADKVQFGKKAKGFTCAGRLGVYERNSATNSGLNGFKAIGLAKLHVFKGNLASTNLAGGFFGVREGGARIEEPVLLR